MRDFVIIPDSSCDLTKEQREQYGIPEYLRSHVILTDGIDRFADLDWSFISPEKYYSDMAEKKVVYKTSGVSLTDAERTFEKYLSEGKDVLCITLSSGISSTYGYCAKAAETLSKKYPEGKVVCVDSLRYSTALSILIMLAAEKKAQGGTIEEVAAYIEEKRHCIHQIGSMDDMFFLVRTGRISNAKAFFASLVGINVLADFNERGVSHVLAKVRGKRSAIATAVQYMKETVISPEEQTVFVAHSNRPEAAEELRALVEKEIAPRRIITNHVGMACGANIGPGLCAVYYMGKPISHDMEDEKALITRLTKKQKS